jgi:hypothetical protein
LYKGLVEKTFTGRDHLRNLGEDNIEMDVKEIGYEDMHWIQMAQDRVQ